MVRSIWILLLIGLTIIMVSSSHASKLEVISDDQVSTLRAEFKNANSPTKDLLKKDWNCQLFGMRSRMQVQDKKNFYAFNGLAASDFLENGGAQLVQKYKAKSSGLVGVKGPLLDEVRMAANGRLISELSIPKRPSQSAAIPSRDLDALAKGNRTVIAYALCD